MSWESKISVVPGCNSFCWMLSSSDIGSQMPGNSESQALAGRSCLKEATWPQTNELKSEKHTQFLWLQNLRQVSVSQEMALSSVFTSAGGASEDLELFMRKRTHFLAFVKWSNRSPSQHLCPLAIVQTGNTKHLRIVTKWIIPRIDPKDGRVGKVWTNRIKGEVESGRCRPI